MRSFLLRTLVWILLTLLVIGAGFTVWAKYNERHTAEEIAPNSGTFVQAGDVKLFVQTFGDPGDRPIILLHGMAAWGGTWLNTIKPLIQNGWYVVTIDMPPFGFSERPADKSYWRTSQVPRIEVVMNKLEIQRAVILAHSYGSRGALEFAMEKPSRVRGLVLVAPALDGIYGTPPSRSFIASALLWIPPVRHGLVALTMTNPLLSRTLLQTFMHKKEAATDDMVQLYRMPGGRVHSTRDFGYWLQGFLSGADVGRSSNVAEFEKLRMPVNLIWGREDTTTPISQSEKLVTYIQGSSVLIMEGVGHMPHIEDTANFNTNLIGILRQRRFQ